MTGFKKYLLFILAISSTYLAHAQNATQIAYAKLPLKIAIGNHAVGFPYQNSFSAFNPQLSVGTELALNKSQKHQIIAASSLGFIRNQVIGNTIMLDIDLGYRYLHKSGVYIETSLGLGVLDQFHPRDIYVQSEVDGTYDKVSDKGTFASLIGNKMGIGYDFSKRSELPFRLDLSHHFFIQSPYFDVASFPIMPQSVTSLSITYKFKK